MKLKKLVIYMCIAAGVLTGCSQEKKSYDAEQVMNESQEGQGYDAEGIDVQIIHQKTIDSVQEGEQASGVSLDGAAADSNTGNSKARIVCWGDSLTEGTGGDGVTYPNTLEKLSGRKVLNYGVYAETASCIAARQGGNPMHVDEEFTIPADCKPVEVKPVNEKGVPEMLLVFGEAGINPCSIGGIEGTLSLSEASGGRVFTRSESGEETVIKVNTPVLFHAMLDKRDDDILVIFTGTNDYPDTNSIKDVIAYQRAMLTYADASQYVVIGMTKKKAMAQIEDINKILANEYGEHFLDIREYLMKNGLKDAGVEETAQDRIDMENGEIPSSLRTDDEGHGTSAFYRIIGEQLYKKMCELNYL